MSSNQSESHVSFQVTNSSIPVIITLVLLVFLFLGFLSIYFCRCLMEYMNNATGLIRRNSNANALRRGSAPQGLDPNILLSFPTFEYSKVKHLRQEKYGLECAICIAEFQDDDMLRLITECNHAFHPECIDLWLSSHTTCPVCRRDLGSPRDKSPEKSPEVRIMMPNDVEREQESSLCGDTHRISLSEEDEEEIEEEERRRCRNDVGLSAHTEETLGGGGHDTAQRFSRSHSTGHSIIREHDRYTLRLPENVKERIIRRHNWTRSCTKFGDYSGNVTVEKSGLGELSGIPRRDEIKV